MTNQRTNNLLVVTGFLEELIIIPPFCNNLNNILPCNHVKLVKIWILTYMKWIFKAISRHIPAQMAVIFFNANMGLL